tara:strand:+ start:653 stop:1291 length:639 start_codon:yes stop_codon:yes gene_type:complete
MKSGFKKTPFAIDYTFYVFENIINDVDFSAVSKIIKSKEKKIIRSSPKSSGDGNTGLGNDSLTSKFGYFNVLKWQEPDIQKIKNHIIDNVSKFYNRILQEKPEDLKIQCWANVMRKGQQIKPHVHDTSNNCLLGGHICVDVDNTSTHYINPFKYFSGIDQETYSSKNEVGKITLFSDNIPHYTDEVISKDRVTIAFDIINGNQKHNDNYIKL